MKGRKEGRARERDTVDLLRVDWLRDTVVFIFVGGRGVVGNIVGGVGEEGVFGVGGDDVGKW